MYLQQTNQQWGMSRKMEFSGTLLYSMGLLLFLIGIALAIIGMISAIARRTSEKSKDSENEDKRDEGKIRGGGVVVIGPIPIIFGTDKRMLLIAVAAAIGLMAIYILVFASSRTT
jgi:uncharacterized protein (TIGR00304 family)